MARIFRALLIAAVNTIKDFFAFATDNGESQVGDTVKLNDGMATSNYDWSAYPEDNTPNGLPWTQPVLSADGTLGGDSFAVYGTNVNGGWYTWQAFDNNGSSMYYTTVLPAEITMYNPQPLKVTQLEYVMYDTGRTPTSWEWYGSNDNNTYELITSGTRTGYTSSFILTFPKSKYYKYYKLKVLTTYDTSSLDAKQINLTAYTEPPFSATGTIESVKKIGDDFVYGMQEPEQDNKEVTINTGEMYYAYTNSNDESVYTVDNPIKERTFNLENASVVGTLTDNNGIFSGFTTSNYLLTQDAFNPQNQNWNIEVNLITGDNVVTEQGFIGGGGAGYKILVEVYNQHFRLMLSSNNSSFDIINGYGSYTVQPSTEYWIRISYDTITGYKLEYKTSSADTYTLDISTSDTTNIYNVSLPTSLGANKYSTSGSVNLPFYGYIDMENTSITIDGVRTTFCSFSNPSTLYDNTFTPLDPQPSFDVNKAGLENASIVGTLTDNNGVYSGFSNDDFINLGKNYKSQNNAIYEIRFMPVASSNSGQQVINCEPLFNLGIIDGKLYTYNFGEQQEKGGATLDLNIMYDAKITINNYNKIFELKKANEQSYTTIWSGTDNAMNTTANTDIVIGKHSTLTDSIFIFSGYIDMENTSITIDGQPTTFYNSKADIIIGNNLYERNSGADETKDIPGLTINTVDNTTIQSVTIDTTDGYIDTSYYAYTNTNDNTDTLYATDNPVDDGSWKNPLLSADGTLGGDNPACTASHENLPAYYAFDGDITTGDRAWWTNHGITSVSNPCWITYYNPNPIKVNYVEIMNEVATPESPKTGVVQGSNDNDTWTDLAEIHVPSNTAGLKTTIQVNAAVSYKYFRFYFTEGWGSGGVSIQEITLFGEASPSTLYENTSTTEFTPIALDPQPTFTIKEAGLKNASIVGELNNENGVFSGFSSSSGIVSSTTFSNTFNTFEILMKIKTSNNITDNQIFFCTTASTSCEIALNVWSGTFAIFLSSNGQSWDIANAVHGSYSVLLNTNYYVKLVYNGSNYVFSYSLDGATFINDITINDSTKVGSFTPTIGNWVKNGTNPETNYFSGSIDMKNTSVTIDGQTTNFYNPKSGIIIENDLYERNSTKDDYIITLVPATIETSANITTSNNDTVITDGSYHLFNITIPQNMTPIIESSGISYQTNEMPLLLKSNTGVGLLIKDGNNAYYRNTWVITRDYDLHYQQINFSYPSGATVTFKVNNAPQNDLTPICYCGDVISWTCDNAGTITTGTYIVKYSNLDGNIQIITIS